MVPIELITEVMIKEESNFWKIKQSIENGCVLKAGGAQITITFEGITAFPMKTTQNERNEIYSNQIKIEELTDGLSRMTLKNKKTEDRETTAKTRGIAEEDSNPQGIQHGVRKWNEGL